MTPAHPRLCISHGAGCVSRLFQPAIIPEEAFAVAHCHGQVNVGQIDMVGAGPQELTRGRVQQAPCSIRPSPSSRAEMAMVSTSCFLFLRGLK